MSEINVTVTDAGSSNVTATSSSTYTATVGNGGSVNVSLGTISPGNATVVSGTLTINSTTTLTAGSSAYAKNAGTAYAAKLDLGIPAGPATLVTVGNTTTLAAGSNATVTSNLSGSNLTLAFGIPRGVTPSFAIGSVTTGAAGSSASVTATTLNSGANVTLDLTIPRGDPGTSGTNGSNLTLSDSTPSALGTAAAGTSSTASRSDHTHALPVIAYGNLSAVPSNFPTNTTLVSGLSAGYSAANHGHNYVTGFNNLTGNLTLAAGSNVTLTANGSTITIDSTGGGGSYTLPTASSNVLGGIKVGSGLAIASGVLSVTAQVTPSAPQSVTAIVNPNSNDNVSWTAPAVGSASTYEVQQAGSGSLPYRTIGTTASTTFTLAGVTRSNQDGYRVRGLTAIGVPGEWGYTSNAPTQNEFSIVEATTASAFPATGASGTLYISTDVSRVYRWSGSVYVELGPQ